MLYAEYGEMLRALRCFVREGTQVQLWQVVHLLRMLKPPHEPHGQALDGTIGLKNEKMRFVSR